MAEHPGENRRKGRKDRRLVKQDRRNAERVAEDVGPRRNPEVPDRRKSADRP
jgi:hypothetical protein